MDGIRPRQPIGLGFLNYHPMCPPDLLPQMPYLWLILHLCFCLWFFTPVQAQLVHLPAPPEIDVQRLIQAIKTVEDWQGKDGVHGERGPMQWKASRWLQISSRPFVYADRPTAKEETDHVTKLITELYQLGYKHPSIYLCALLHNSGMTAMKERRTGAQQKDYAARVEAIYNAL